MSDQPNAQPDLDELKARHPLQEVAARYATLRKSGGYLVGCCPFHDDHKPSFSVHLATATWRCWSACDVGGDVIDLVGYARYGAVWNSRDAGMFKMALSILEGDPSIGAALPPLRQPLPPEWNNPAEWQPIELETGAQLALGLAARIYHTALLEMGQGAESPYAYLRARGFDDATIRREGIGYADGRRLGPALVAGGLSRPAARALNLLVPERGDREWLAGRIVFVDRDRAGRVLHLVGRKFAPWLREASLKYLSLKAMCKPLYGYARLDRRPGSRPVLVVESPPDAITARQWGFDAVATIGTGLKEEHAVLLARLQRPKVFVPHNDEAGFAAAARWRENIGDGVVLHLPGQAKDLNEFGTHLGAEAEFAKLIKAAGFEPPQQPKPPKRARCTHRPLGDGTLSFRL